MSHVWHLVKHDLRAHRGIVLAWLATVIALPLVAVAPWPAEMGLGFGVGAALFLQVARVLLGMAGIASFVQASSPVDDRSFWRTRPIAPRVLALAHLFTAGVIFVVLPTLVAVAVAIVIGVPRAHWLSTMAQVATLEAALAGVALVIASRTRGIATFVIAAVVGLASMVLLLGSLAELRRLLDWPGYIRMADPVKALAATLSVGAILLPLLFTVGMAGPRRQTAFLAGVLGTVVLAVGVWFLPMLRFDPPPMVDAGLVFDHTSVRLEAVPDTPGAVALVLAARPTHRHPRDQWRGWLKHGKLTTRTGVRWLTGAPTGYAPRTSGDHVAVPVAVLSPSEVAAAAGTRVRLDAEVHADVERRASESHARLAPGASLVTDHQVLRIEGLLPGDVDDVRRMRPILRGTEIYLASPRITFRHGHAYVIGDGTLDCELPLYSWPHAGAGVMRLALLPTLWHPFTVMRTDVAERLESTCPVDLTRAVIEMRTVETRAVSVPSVSLEFTLPATVPMPPGQP